MGQVQIHDHMPEYVKDFLFCMEIKHRIEMVAIFYLLSDSNVIIWKIAKCNPKQNEWLLSSELNQATYDEVDIK